VGRVQGGAGGVQELVHVAGTHAPCPPDFGASGWHCADFVYIAYITLLFCSILLISAMC
jgi:hypothetical protein